MLVLANDFVDFSFLVLFDGDEFVLAGRNSKGAAVDGEPS